MNLPGTVGSKCDWRYRKECLTSELSTKLADFVEKYHRE